MTSFESVLAFGDSQVAGCELDGVWSKRIRSREYLTGQVTTEELDAPGKLLAFPKIIADRFGVPCYNYAMTGSSNHRSLRLLTQAVQDHPNSLVLFGYSETARNEFYYPEGGIGCDNDNFFQAGPENFDTHVNRKYLEILHPYNNLKQIMFCVDSICRLHAKDFLHIPLFGKNWGDEVPKADKLLDFGDCKNYEEWAFKNNFKILEFHFELGAHTALAELIIQKITKGKIC
jgi:hypothetical protein